MNLPKIISHEDYRNLHQNGNRICFDYICSADEFIHYRLLDGDKYELNDNDEVVNCETSYILLDFEDEENPIYLQITLKQAFDILALHNSYILYPVIGHEEAHEKLFVECVQTLFEMGEDNE